MLHRLQPIAIVLSFNVNLLLRYQELLKTFLRSLWKHSPWQTFLKDVLGLMSRRWTIPCSANKLCNARSISLKSLSWRDTLIVCPEVFSVCCGCRAAEISSHNGAEDNLSVTPHLLVGLKQQMQRPLLAFVQEYHHSKVVPTFQGRGCHPIHFSCSLSSSYPTTISQV